MKEKNNQQPAEEVTDNQPIKLDFNPFETEEELHVHKTQKDFLAALGIDAGAEDLDDEDDDDCFNESIDDFARGEGFWIDDDGNWHELEDDDWY